MLFAFGAALVLLVQTAGFTSPPARPQTSSDPQVKKPPSDYMSTFLRRDTKPLGLMENPTLKKYMNQPSIKWVIRSAKKHILH